MANPELSRHIQALPDELNALEGGVGDFRTPAEDRRAEGPGPLAGAVGRCRGHGVGGLRPRLAGVLHLQFERHRGIHADPGRHVAGVGGRVRPIGLAGQIRVRSARGR